MKTIINCQTGARRGVNVVRPLQLCEKYRLSIVRRYGFFVLSLETFLQAFSSAYEIWRIRLWDYPLLRRQ